MVKIYSFGSGNARLGGLYLLAKNMWKDKEKKTGLDSEAELRSYIMRAFAASRKSKWNLVALELHNAWVSLNRIIEGEEEKLFKKTLERFPNMKIGKLK